MCFLKGCSHVTKLSPSPILHNLCCFTLKLGYLGLCRGNPFGAPRKHILNIGSGTAQCERTLMKSITMEAFWFAV